MNINQKPVEEKWSYEIVWEAIRPAVREIVRGFWTVFYKSSKVISKVAAAFGKWARRQKPNKRG